MQTFEAICEFWFGEPSTIEARYPELQKVWYAKNPEFDAQIETQFKSYIQAVANGECDAWLSTPRGYLASIICVDQFPRNCFRNSPQAFAYDHHAQSLTQQGLEAGIDQSLSLYERMFFYIPLEHSEDINLQRKMLTLTKQLIAQASERQREHFKSFDYYAQLHHDIIERFGRFPHRNAVLGRDSTAEELEFLTTKNSSF